MSICFPDTFDLYFEVTDVTCYHWPDQTVELNRVWRNKKYWNSDIVLDYEECGGIDTYFQFFLVCGGPDTEHDSFVLYWAEYSPGTPAKLRQCDISTAEGASQQWEEIGTPSITCDPFQLVFEYDETDTTRFSSRPCMDPDLCDEDPEVQGDRENHSYRFTITETP